MADSTKYPRTLHHPTLPGVTHTVGGKEEESRWRETGWRVTEPSFDGPENKPAPNTPPARAAGTKTEPGTPGEAETK